MKMIVAVALALVAFAAGAAVPPPTPPAPVGEPIPIVRSDVQQQADGAYSFSFESGNGIVQSETGELKEAVDEENKPHTVVVVRGEYSYPGEEGKSVSVTYYADETGFHAEGDTIPKPPSRR